MTFHEWWREDRPIYWVRNGWCWGWLGNGWNRLGLGKVAIYFKSGPSPVARIRRSFLSGSDKETAE